MMLSLALRHAALSLLVAGAACHGGSTSKTRLPSAASVPMCDVGFSRPSGFHLLDSSTEMLGDHIGVTKTYGDVAGHRLDFKSGMSGEAAEGMSLAGSLRVATGEEAELFKNDVAWVLVWSPSGVCRPVVVIGRGFTRSSFLEVLRESEVIAPKG